MYSISHGLDGADISGWINQDILLKTNRGTNSRKRSYDVANIENESECTDDTRRRVLRPRQEPTDNQITPEASRTRPIRSNRGRQYVPTIADQQSAVAEVVQNINSGTSAFQLPTTTGDSPDFLARYGGWFSDYFRNDPSVFHPMQLPSFPMASGGNSVVHGGPPLPYMDSWLIYQYLFGPAASAAYSILHDTRISPDTSPDEAAAAAAISQMNYHNMIREHTRSNAIFWNYPFLFGSNITNNNLTTTPRLHQSDNHQHNLPYYFRGQDQPQRDTLSSSVSIDNQLRSDRVYQGLFVGDNRLSNFSNYPISNFFNFAPTTCPYHHSAVNHALHDPSPPSANLLQQNTTSTSRSMPNHVDSASVQNQTVFSQLHHSPEMMSYGGFWPPTIQNFRSMNYPVNGSNIDTLLHLAAHFEQKKRGISRDELEKLPTHRYKSEKQRHKSKSSAQKSVTIATEEIPKCLVCLDDFEPKQNIRTLCCKHEFHAKCIDKWLKINRTCPLCRADAFDGTAQKDGI